MSTQPLRVTVAASTGKKLQIWRQEGLFHALPAGAVTKPEICLGVDLFEVVAELAELDLGHPGQAAEASRLADQAKESLDGQDPGAAALEANAEDEPEAGRIHGA